MKRTTKTLMASAALLALAGSANAATQINLYGASAQFGFWKAAAGPFMRATTANGGLGCSSTLGPTMASDGKSFIVQGIGCDATLTDGAIDFRVANKASYDGIYAVTGNTDSKASPGSCDKFSRAMADGPASNDSTVTTTASGCYAITLGASDVPASAFVQASSGNLKGPNGGGTISRIFSGIPTSGSDPNGNTLVAPLATYNPVKVPFGFFVKDTVKAKTCTAGPTIGDFCASDSDCGTGGTCSSDYSTISGLSREMATQLFGQKIRNWSQMSGFEAKNVQLCMRHAGSGTAATLDQAVMNSAWGKSLPTAQNTLATKAITYFNDGSSDLFKCMTYTGYTGAVGYADADADISTYSGVVGPIKYNGFYPNSQNIINGIYDFYADQTVYLSGNADAKQKAVADKLLGTGGYLNDATGSHLTGTAYRNFWAASAEMKVVRGSATSINPFLYPSR